MTDEPELQLQNGDFPGDGTVKSAVLSLIAVIFAMPEGRGRMAEMMRMRLRNLCMAVHEIALRTAMIVGIAFPVVGCSHPRLDTADLLGAWGGDRVIVRFTETEGRIEWDCGNAVIEGPFAIDDQGRFKAKGLKYPGYGGPAVFPVPDERKPRAVEYAGSTDGRRMRLVIVRIGRLSPGEPREIVLELEKGRSVMLVKCL
jgi:hypothetical protein